MIEARGGQIYPVKGTCLSAREDEIGGMYDFLFWVILLTSPGLRMKWFDCDDALVGVSTIKLWVMTKCAVPSAWQTNIARYRLFCAEGRWPKAVKALQVHTSLHKWWWVVPTLAMSADIFKPVLE